MAFLGFMMLMLPMRPPTKLRRDSPEMAGMRPEVAGLPPEMEVDGLETGGEVILTERPRNSVSWAASMKVLQSMASEAERFRKREISSWILPALKTAPGIEAILSSLTSHGRNLD